MTPSLDPHDVPPDLRPGRPGDWEAVARVLNAAAAGAGIVVHHTAEELAADLPESERFRLARDLLVAEQAGRAIGAMVGTRAVRDGVLVAETWGAVEPAPTADDDERTLLRATIRRLAAEWAADPRPGPRELRAYADDAEHAKIAILEAEGYVAIRYGFEMRRPLTGRLPEHALPPGLELRPVTAAQLDALFAADAEAFLDHWGHRAADASDRAAFAAGPETDLALWRAAWDGDEAAGLVVNTIYRAENERFGVRRGWLDRVSVRRPWRGRGVAKALCAASFAVLREAGADEAWLGVDAANPTGALGPYEGLGFTVARRWRAFGRPIDGPAPAGWRSGSGS